MVRISSKCPPGVICVSPGLITFAIIAIGIAGVFLFLSKSPGTIQQLQQISPALSAASAPSPQPIQILKRGDKIPLTSLITTTGETVLLTGGRGLIHLQLRSFVNPSNKSIFSASLKSYAGRMGEIVPAKIKSVAIFALDEATMKDQMSYFEWTIGLSLVPDPKQEIFRLCGAEKASTTMGVHRNSSGGGSGSRPTSASSASPSLFKMFRSGHSLKGAKDSNDSINDSSGNISDASTKANTAANAAPSVKETKPLDVLLDAKTGIVVAVKYGTHAEDHWTVSELLGQDRTIPKQQ